MASYSPFNQYFIWFINYTQYVHLNNTVYWNVCVCDLGMQKDMYKHVKRRMPSFSAGWLCVPGYDYKKKGQPLCQQISGTSFLWTSILQSRLCEDQAEDTFSISLFIIDAVIMAPGSVLVDLVAVSSGSYPAVPDSVRPDSCNLHQGLLQPHLWV